MPSTRLLFDNSALALDASRRWAGYAALMRGLKLEAPLTERCAVASGHVKGSVRLEGELRVYDQRYRPADDIAGHLLFALKHETLDLLVLKRVLQRLGAEAVTHIIGANASRQQARRLWFLYEWLTGEKLPLSDAPASQRYIPLLDPSRYFTAAVAPSPRHKIGNNLPGVPAFCPIVRKTPVLEAFVRSQLADRVQQVMGRTAQDVWRRAASFLLLADSRASFAIEGERPPRSRLERWANVVRRAGAQPLSLDEILHMHDELIHDHRFVAKGLRTQGVFLGERDRDGEPIPEFIGARAADLPDLMAALLDSHRIMTERDVDPVIHAALIAFGFVFIHPFEDGNGRVHRALIHHILAERSFAPAGLVFPVSAVMLERIDGYRNALRQHSGPLMPFIEWQPNARRNVDVLNDTADLYRFGDYTALAEYLYACVEHTITQLLPDEVRYLQCHDRALAAIAQRIDMPENLARDLIMFITQNDMKLPARRRKKEFAALTDAEVQAIEADVAQAFADQYEYQSDKA
ncbi:Fido domain-containing protein [Aromatoleum bremense]|uniref:Cell filamentation protein Fic n=1 Tax=Aromatoleum bremense TaxID=76115 RepID=A0ABX1NXA8_9RHOO|nr:cell filamentation protein Fic [Aromatoleum bremense]QTQ33512.1 Fido domain-containing protein [Aromatoleum bremense]